MVLDVDMVTAFACRDVLSVHSLEGMPSLTKTDSTTCSATNITTSQMNTIKISDNKIILTQHSFLTETDSFIKKPMSPPPLPKETVIGGHPYRIWHKSQKNYCKRCASHGHRTSDIGMCGSYDPDIGVVAFRANNNPLSNYYMCTITVGEWQFRSAEHAYQWKKCKHAKRPDLAQRVYEAKYPAEAKDIAMALKTDENSPKWDNIKVRVMEYILHAKWNCCERFRQTLMSTADTGHVLGGRCCTQPCATNKTR